MQPQSDIMHQSTGYRIRGEEGVRTDAGYFPYLIEGPRDVSSLCSLYYFFGEKAKSYRTFYCDTFLRPSRFSLLHQKLPPPPFCANTMGRGRGRGPTVTEREEGKECRLPRPNLDEMGVGAISVPSQTPAPG